MLRIHLIALLGLSLVMIAKGDDPKPKPEPKPQWQRLLTGADAQKAVELEKQIGKLEEADNYAEALKRRKELLALRTRVQGADHWETVNEKGALTATTKVAALSEEKRAGWRRAAKGAETADAAGRLARQAEYGKAFLLWQERLKWCREVVGEEHPETAQSYNYLGFYLNAQGKYAEAGPLYQKALEIRRKVLSEDHPDTASSYNNVAYNLNSQGKYVEAEPLYLKALDISRKVLGEDHPDTASSYNTLAANLADQGKFAESRPLLQKALDIRRKILGEEHLDTANSYNTIGYNLQSQGNFEEAGPLFQKALDIRRKILGEEHTNTATTYNNVAHNLQSQGKYREAGPLYQKALDICRKVLGEDHPQTAISYNALANNLKLQGKFGEAAPLHQKALDICRKVLGEEHPLTATSYNGVATNLHEQGEYGEAGPLYQKALDIRRKILGEDHLDTAVSYNNVGDNLEAQRMHKEAGPLLQKALDIFRKVHGEEHALTANSYNNVAVNLNAQGKYDEARLLFQKALDIQCKVLGKEHPDTANGYNNLGSNLQTQGKFAEAEPLYQKALDIRRKVLGEDHPYVAAGYESVALNLQAQGKYPEALATVQTAARSYEAARLSVAASGLKRAAFGHKQSPYAFLAATYRRAERPADAWAALESDLARGLLDESAQRQSASLGLTSAEQRQSGELQAKRASLDTRVLVLARKPQRTDAETAELERLVVQRRQLEMALADLAVLVSKREVVPLAQLQTVLPADAAFVAWVDATDQSGRVQEHWGCVVRPLGTPHWERLPGSGPAGEWTKEDSELPRQFQAALAKPASAAGIDALAKKLHAQRLAPLQKHLDGVKRLLVAPVNKMAGIPVETLTDQYTVSYIPSCTYLVRLKDRQRPQAQGLLAVGDPVFPPAKDVSPPHESLPPGGLLITQVLPGGAAANARLQTGDVLVAYAGQEITSLDQFRKLVAANATEKTIVVKVWREGQDKLSERELTTGRLGIALAKEPAREAITSRRQGDQLLAQLRRGETYAELPGTQVEIARLTELFDSRTVTTLTRAAASEQQIDELRKADKLKQFRYLHFATHGKANNTRSFESALLLTPPPKLPEVRAGEPYLEGRLTAGEVLESWHLDAELVTLSACESGLGRRGGGDGLLGFAQAFLMAGSRSVCLTLWQVDDTATALLMDRFYRNLLGKRTDGAKPMSKAAALREAKEFLRTLKGAEALERLGALTQGVVRGERPAREEMQAVPKPQDAGKDYRPYAHPRYWAAFILIGDPD